MKRILMLLAVIALLVAMAAPSALAARPTWYTQNSANPSQIQGFLYHRACTTFVAANPGWTDCSKTFVL